MQPQDLAAAVDDTDGLRRRAAAQLLRLHRRRRRAGHDRARRRRAGRRRVRSDQPGPVEAARRLGRRHRRGRRPHARHADAIRRPVPGHHGLPREARAPHAGPHRRPDSRPPRQSLLRAHAANPRAAHPPRKGHQQRLHQPRPVRPAGDDLPRAARPARPARNGQPVPAEVRATRAEQICARTTRFELAFDARRRSKNSSSATAKDASRSCWPTRSTPASSPACRWGNGIRSWTTASWLQSRKNERRKKSIGWRQRSTVDGEPWSTAAQRRQHLAMAKPRDELTMELMSRVAAVGMIAFVSPLRGSHDYQ